MADDAARWGSVVGISCCLDPGAFGDVDGTRALSWMLPCVALFLAKTCAAGGVGSTSGASRKSGPRLDSQVLGSVLGSVVRSSVCSGGVAGSMDSSAVSSVLGVLSVCCSVDAVGAGALGVAAVRTAAGRSVGPLLGTVLGAGSAVGTTADAATDKLGTVGTVVAVVAAAGITTTVFGLRPAVDVVRVVVRVLDGVLGLVAAVAR